MFIDLTIGEHLQSGIHDAKPAVSLKEAV